MNSSLDFIRETGPEPHIGRTRQILAKHPEIRKLFGYDRSSIFWTFTLVGIQVALAIGLRHAPWWLWLATLYFVGGTINHALWVMIHDCTHNLATGKERWDRWLAIVANIAIAVPGSAMEFRRYHLLHHRYQGELARDADLPSPWEIRAVGNCPIRKTLWLLFFSIVQGVVRPLRLGKTNPLDKWSLTNLLVVGGALAVIGYFGGWGAPIYLLLSTFFAVGLHPFGARWIQEHFVFREGQETYSYYGPLNRLMFNVGFHNEHHDFMAVPWSKLPRVRRTAPEFYDTLEYHTSYLNLLWRFISDPRQGPHARVVRPTPIPASRRAQLMAEEAAAINNAAKDAAQLSPAT